PNVTPSARINIKKAILNALRTKGHVEIELILGEFGRGRWSWEQWDGSLESFILAGLQDAEDSVLHGIAEHVGAGVDPPRPPPDGLPAFWRPGHFRLFITHVKDDKARAARLRDVLAAHYISGFVAHEDIEPTDAGEAAT